MRIELLKSERIKSVLKMLFPIVMVTIILIEGRKELSSIKLDEVIFLLKSLPSWRMVTFIAGGVLASSTAFIHDLIISKEFGKKLPRIKVFQISFISNALNNLIGGFSSAGVRVMLYKKEGINPKVATYYNVLILTSFSTGLSILAIVIPFNLKSLSPIFKQYEFSLVAVIAVLTFIPVFLLINRIDWIREKLLGINRSKFVSYALLRKLLLSSSLEWMMTALFFTLVSLYLSPSGSFIDLFSVFIIASIVGVLSLSPGAVGAFDVTLLLGMSVINIDSHKAVASLILFRLFYTLVPVIIAFFIGIPLIFQKKGIEGE